MILLAFTAFSIGAIHSLEPAHWLPIALIARSKHWSVGRAVLGAVISSLGNILTAAAIAAAAVLIGEKALAGWGEELEHYSAWGLIVFGILYAIYSYRNHLSCHDHEHGHHGPRPGRGRNAFVFIFFLGASPCVAIFPLLSAAIPHGIHSILLTLGAFSAGTALATIGATALAASGVRKLDWPFLEHHGETLTGVGVALLGVGLLFFH